MNGAKRKDYDAFVGALDAAAATRASLDGRQAKPLPHISDADSGSVRRYSVLTVNFSCCCRVCFPILSATVILSIYAPGANVVRGSSFRMVT